MLVRFKHFEQGHKPKGMPVVLPVGMKSKSMRIRVGKTVWLNPTAEIPDEDALKLVSIDPFNFELVEAAPALVPPPALPPKDTEPAPAPEPVLEKPKRKYTKRKHAE